jgi:hypothetical protein
VTRVKEIRHAHHRALDAGRRWPCSGRRFLQRF